jgi:hypothetical protein
MWLQKFRLWKAEFFLRELKIPQPLGCIMEISPATKDVISHSVVASMCGHTIRR